MRTRRRGGLLLRGIAALALPLVATAARGDGGVLCTSERSDALIVSVFTAPAPARVGALDVSVLVQDGEDRDPVLDARVDLAMHREEVELDAVAGHATATNKLLYAATVDVPAAGRWTITARVHSGARLAAVACAVDVGGPSPPVVAFWPYLVLPFALIALFALQQWLKATRSLPESPG